MVVIGETGKHTHLDGKNPLSDNPTFIITLQFHTDSIGEYRLIRLRAHWLEQVVGTTANFISFMCILIAVGPYFIFWGVRDV